jgi:hypothetical protein
MDQFRSRAHEEAENNPGSYQNTVRYLVEWMQEKPEVIAYLRSLYTDDALPDWVGTFKEEVDHAEILRKEGHRITRHE